MKFKILLFLLLLLVPVLIFTGCDINFQSPDVGDGDSSGRAGTKPNADNTEGGKRADLNEWAGEYYFYEYAPTDQNMIYYISIYEESGVYFALIEIDGFQTQTRKLAKVVGNKNNIDLVFEQYLEDDTDMRYPENQYKQGDVILSLSQKDSEIYTTWGKWKPLLQANYNSGVYLVKLDNYWGDDGDYDYDWDDEWDYEWDEDWDDFSYGLYDLSESAFFRLRAIYKGDGLIDYAEYGIPAEDYYLYIVPAGTGLIGLGMEDYFVWWDSDALYYGDDESPYILFTDENKGTTLTLWNFYRWEPGTLDTMDSGDWIFEYAQSEEIPEYILASYNALNLDFGNNGYIGEFFPAVFGDWDNLTLSDYNDFGGYLLEFVPEAWDNVVQRGMSVLVTGDTSEVDGFICMDVILGTSHDDNFVREIYYTITPEGTIFKYDIFTDGWEVVFGAVG